VKWRAVPIFCASISLAVIIAGCAWGYQRYAQYREGVTTQGRVVEIRAYWSEDSEGRRGVNHYPVVEFRSSVEKQHRFTGDAGLDEYEVGESVNVLYDPRNPGDARIATFAQFWLGPLAVVLFGFLSGIGTFLFSRSFDRAFGAAFQHRMTRHAREMDRLALADGKQGVLLRGVVDSVRKQQGASGEEYVVVCRATLPGGISQERVEAEPIFFHPGPLILGKSVEIYVDPRKKERYAVMLQPVLAELQSAKR